MASVFEIGPGHPCAFLLPGRHLLFLLTMLFPERCLGWCFPLAEVGVCQTCAAESPFLEPPSAIHVVIVSLPALPCARELLDG